MLRSVVMFPCLRRGWLVTVALLASGCLAPTLPLPPPSNPTVASTDTQGLIRLTGTVEPQSEVFALNHNNSLISGQYTDSGSYDFKIAAEEGDFLTLWYAHGTLESPSNDFVVKLAPPAQ